MRKFKIFLGIFVTLALIIGGSIFALNYKKQEEKFSEAIQAFNNEKPGIYYLYYDGCPWCKDLKPVFNEIISEKKGTYQEIDTHHKSLTPEKKEELRKTVEKYTKSDEIIVPLLVFISEDKSVQYHIGTVSTHDATEFSLNGKQRDKLEKELNTIYDLYEKHNKPKTTPSKEKTTSSKEKTKSSKEETKSSKKGTTSSKEKTVPSKEDAKSSKKETTPSKKKTTPDKKKTTPSK